MKQETSNKRNCPACHKCLYYSNVYNLEKAVMQNSLCNSCTIKQNPKFGNKDADMIGVKHQMLTVLSMEVEILQPNKKRYLYTVQCDCGNVKQINRASLKRIYSCGCYRKTTLKNKGSKHKNWGGHEAISLRMFNKIKSRAARRKIPFNVSIEFLWDLHVKQNGKCALSGETLIHHQSSHASSGNSSLDRIDSKLGYTESNIQWVTKQVNISKNTTSDRDFIKMCKMVAQHNT